MRKAQHDTDDHIHLKLFLFNIHNKLLIVLLRNTPKVIV